jgi:hypothetical protein
MLVLLRSPVLKALDLKGQEANRVLSDLADFGMSVVYAMEQHNQVLNLWRAQNSSSLSILHLDFHDDLRGLLINRRTQRAYRIWDRFPSPDQGNFLSHAIIEGRVRSVRWVHDEPGGRQYDLKTVKYESDLSGLPHRLLLRIMGRDGIPIEYEVLPCPEWTGINNGEHLDIDWDFFASREYPVNSIGDRVEAFFNKSFDTVPDQIYVCYSPEYSHPSRSQFRHFIDRLQEFFRAEVVYLEESKETNSHESLLRKHMPAPLFRFVRRVFHAAGLSLRKRGIY